MCLKAYYHSKRKRISEFPKASGYNCWGKVHTVKETMYPHKRVSKQRQSYTHQQSYKRQEHLNQEPYMQTGRTERRELPECSFYSGPVGVFPFLPMPSAKICSEEFKAQTSKWKL